jgi:hypothetical protein
MACGVSIVGLPAQVRRRIADVVDSTATIDAFEQWLVAAAGPALAVAHASRPLVRRGEQGAQDRRAAIGWSSEIVRDGEGDGA